MVILTPVISKIVQCKFSCLVMLIVLPLFVISQEPGDSARLVNRIEKFSNKRHITRLIFPVVFNPVSSELSNCNDSVQICKIKKSYQLYEGRVIRKISITTLDPFGYDLSDTAERPNNTLSKAGNSLHVRSMPLTIRNLILVKRYDRFDSLMILESERLLRKQTFVRDALINPVLINDSVDLNIRVQDVWSLVPQADISGSNLNFSFREQNFMGTGHQLKYEQDRNLDSGRYGFGAEYEIPNIENTYIDTRLRYKQALDGSYVKHLEVGRDFYSPYVRWAGGLLIEQQLLKDTSGIPGSVVPRQNFKFNTNDYWLGNSWQLLKGRGEEERNTNLLLTTRWKRIRYLERPTELKDTVKYSNESNYLLGIGINSQKFIRDSYLFKYGDIEDIPIGRSYNLILGYRVFGKDESMYTGLKMSWGDFYNCGYLSASLEYGTFWDKSGIGQGAVNAGVNYFTRLMQTGKWKYRQFIRSDIVWGTNRLASDQLTFNDYMNTGGFDGNVARGTGKIRLTFQTQSYAPWDLLGFRLGPYLVYSIGMLGNEKDGFSAREMFSYLGLGLLIRNDFLKADYFQISLSFYPVIPALGNNILKYNSLQTTDFGLHEFNQVKPELVSYQ